jgi:nickel-dependent lactate racemase
MNAMPPQEIQIPYSKSMLSFTLPGDLQADVAVSKPTLSLNDVNTAVRRALEQPVGSPPLRELARPGQRACIVFTDITRACPDELLVPALLAELVKAGVRDQDITLLCATGLHRPSTPAEKVSKLGVEIAARYRVIDNEPQNPAALIDLGFTPDGAPVQIHRAAVEADLLLATGIVEPHQYAGYSGGRKIVAVGAAGEATIA